MHQPSRSQIVKTNFSEFCRPIVRSLAGQLADKPKENFAFTIHFLSKWCIDYLKNSEKSFVKLLTRQNFDFIWKKEYFLAFDIFWDLEIFLAKKCLPAIGRPIAGWVSKKNFGKKNQKLKKFSRILIFFIWKLF